MKKVEYFKNLCYTQYSNDLIESVRNKYSPLYGHDINEPDAAEILNNLIGFLKVISEDDKNEE